MLGRIRDEDIAEVREKARIDEVVSGYVTLRNAGSGSMKGLCPFHDEKSPSFHVNTSRGFFHCLAGETRVLTWSGARPIADLAGGEHTVLGVGGRWVTAPFRSYGHQPLLRITLGRDRRTKELYATSGHRWFLRSGRAGDERREVVTTDLRAGDRLEAMFPGSRIRRTTPSPFGIAHGFTYGDGTRSGTGSTALLCPPQDQAMLKWFPNSHTSASGENLLVHDLPRFFTDLPPLDESVPYLYGWLAGYFAADGSVAADGTLVLDSADRSSLEHVRDVCTRLGIDTFGITTQLGEGSPGREPAELHRVQLVDESLTESFFLLDAHRERFLAAERSSARRGWIVQSVEETERVEEVYCAEVEDGHAFALEDNILTGNCFGCQEGGDAIAFVQKMDGLGFVEAVERLADQFGVQLRREEGDEPQAPRGPQRGRLVEANRVAEAFYREQLAAPDAIEGRRFLDSRGFDQAAAERFGVGFAPRDGEALLRHLRGRGITDEEAVAAGLISVGRSAYDRFRGRLLWPIRDASKDVIGFGARRIFDDDRIDAKYLNTSETTLYKKSRVLYGLDLARKDIGLTSQAVIVEGYTDVMACHLAGVPTAVATCGTAFGDDHAKVLRRFMHDHEEFRGEVVFAFDGDAAGEKAAIRAFAGDANFVSQTYVAVQPDGLDPCDLRLKEGDGAVRELVASRVPLYRFVLGNVVARYDLDRADSRVDALREAAGLVTSIRDRSKVDAFIRELSQMVGVDPEEARVEVRRAAARGPKEQTPPRRPPGGSGPDVAAPAERRPALPDLRDPRFAMERETLKLVIQVPGVLGRAVDDLDADDFTHPTYRGVWEAVVASGGPRAGAGDASWASRIAGATDDPAARAAVSALGVEAVPNATAPDAAYVNAHALRLQELTVMRRIAQLKSRLQRTNPVEEQAEYNRMFGELVALEHQRRTLRDRLVSDG